MTTDAELRFEVADADRSGRLIGVAIGAGIDREVELRAGVLAIVSPKVLLPNETVFRVFADAVMALGMTRSVDVLLSAGPPWDPGSQSALLLARRRMSARLQAWGGRVQPARESYGGAAVYGAVSAAVLPDLLAAQAAGPANVVLIWPARNVDTDSEWLPGVCEDNERVRGLPIKAIFSWLASTSDALLWWVGSADSPDAFLCIVGTERRLLALAPPRTIVVPI